MAFVLTNGTYFISHNKRGGIIKVTQIEQAQDFYSLEKAINQLKKTPGKCKSYYVVDTSITDIVSNEHETETNVSDVGIKKTKRKQYSESQRKIIYKKSCGRCQLCGRKIRFEDMTVDHIIPLDSGGSNDIDNAQATCIACNRFKANILPAMFFDRITEIFMYQMEKKYESNTDWRMARNLLMEIL